METGKAHQSLPDRRVIENPEAVTLNAHTEFDPAMVRRGVLVYCMMSLRWWSVVFPVQINTNGPINFGTCSSTFSASPFGSSNSISRVAAFWNDILAFGVSTIFYRVTSDMALLQRARSTVNAWLAMQRLNPTFNPERLVIVTFDRVQGYSYRVMFFFFLSFF